MIPAPIFKNSILIGCFNMSSEQLPVNGQLMDQSGVEVHHPRSWAAGVIGSIILHALALSVFLWAAQNIQLPKNPPSVLDVSLVRTLLQSDHQVTEDTMSNLSQNLFPKPHHEVLRHQPTKIAKRENIPTIIRPVPPSLVTHTVPSPMGKPVSMKTKKVVHTQIIERILPRPQPRIVSSPSVIQKAVHAEHLAPTLQSTQRKSKRQTRPAGGQVRQVKDDIQQVRLFQGGAEVVVKKQPFKGDPVASETILPSAQTGSTTKSLVSAPGTLQPANATSPIRRVDQSQSTPASESRPGLVRKTLRTSVTRMVPMLNTLTSGTGEGAVRTFLEHEPTTVKRGSKILSQPFAGSSTIKGSKVVRVPPKDSLYPSEHTDTRKPVEVKADGGEFLAKRKKIDQPVVIARLQPKSVVRGSGSMAQEMPTDFGWLGALLSTRLQGLSRVYPSLAKRQSWEGTVLLQVEIRQDGGLSGLRVARSSGYDTLDQDAMELIRKVCPLPVLQPLALPKVALRVPVRYSLSDES